VSRCSVETLTAAGSSENIPLTAEFYVNQATVPLGVAVFSCACGATQIECGLERPSGWSTAADGSDCCPHCASSNQPEDDQAAWVPE
jgi:hypothetical protein